MRRDIHTTVTVALATLLAASVIFPFAGPVGVASAQAGLTLEWQATTYDEVGGMGGLDDIEARAGGIYTTGNGDSLTKLDLSGSVVWNTSNADAQPEAQVGVDESAGIAAISDNADGTTNIFSSADGSLISASPSTGIPQNVNINDGYVYGLNYDYIEVYDSAGNEVAETAISTANEQDIVGDRDNDVVYFVWLGESIKKYNYQTDAQLADEATSDLVHTLEFSHEEQILFAQQDNQTIRYDTGVNEVDHVDSVAQGFTGLDILEEKQYIVTAEAGGNVTIWDYNLSVVDSYNVSATTGTIDAVAMNAEGGNVMLYVGSGTDDTLYKFNTGIPAGEPTMETNLELEIDSWMPVNSTQSYSVFLNETNTTTGDTNLTDVTADANVTSNNVSIVAVNNSTDQIESFDIVGRTFVSATYDGETSANVNVTVGPRNLTNIGIMPPGQWVCAFLECDLAPGGGDNPHNIGSPTQWILLLIVIMATAARMFDNPWAGVGSGMMASILFWILGYVTLGIALSTVFYGILVGVALVRARRANMSVNVGR